MLGSAALILSSCSLSTASLKSTILANVDKISSLSTRTITGGRLNVDKAIRACAAPTQPAAPTGLAAQPGNAQVSLAWNSSGGATSYNVYASTTSGGPYNPIATGIATTSYSANGLTNGTAYYFVVTAVNTAGESEYSNEATGTPALVKPTAPTNLTAQPGDTKATLQWSPSSGAASYNVYVSTTSGGPYNVIATGIIATAYTATALTNGTTYYFVVSGVNTSGESGYSNQVSVIPSSAPPAPPKLSAKAGSGSATLTWTTSAGATSYNVYRSTTSGTGYTKVATVTATTYVNTGLTNFRTYYYVVTAVGPSGESAYSNQVRVTPPWFAQ